MNHPLCLHFSLFTLPICLSALLPLCLSRLSVYLSCLFVCRCVQPLVEFENCCDTHICWQPSVIAADGVDIWKSLESTSKKMLLVLSFGPITIINTTLTALIPWKHQNKLRVISFFFFDICSSFVHLTFHCLNESRHGCFGFVQAVCLYKSMRWSRAEGEEERERGGGICVKWLNSRIDRCCSFSSECGWR